MLEDDHIADEDLTLFEETEPLSGVWRVECLKSVAEMRDNAQAWLALERDCLDPNAAFQCYDWCISWATVFCKPVDDTEPRIFFIYRGDTLVAILPMMVTNHAGVRLLTLFGEPHSQLASSITKGGVDCRDGLELCIAQACLLSGADVITFGPIPADSPLIEAMDPNCIERHPAAQISTTVWPEIWRSEDYFVGLTKNRRKDFNRKSRQLKRVGKIKFQRHDANSEAFAPLVHQALRYKRGWLDRNGMWSLGLTRDGVDEFLTNIADYNGGYQVEVDELKVDETTIAIGINLVGKQVRHNYLSAYDDDYKRFSPGTLLCQLSIQNSIDDGMNGFSFLGYPTVFKDHWANQKTRLVGYQKPLTLRGKIWLEAWIGFIKPTAKRLIVTLRKASRRPNFRVFYKRFIS